MTISIPLLRSSSLPVETTLFRHKQSLCILILLYRQRQITSDATMFSLAQRHLPRELLQELKMPVPVGGKIPRKRIRPDDDETEDSSEVTWTQSS